MKADCHNCRHSGVRPNAEPCTWCSEDSLTQHPTMWEPSTSATNDERIETDHRGAPPCGATYSKTVPGDIEVVVVSAGGGSGGTSADMPLAPPSRGEEVRSPCDGCHHKGAHKSFFPCAECDVDSPHRRPEQRPSHWQRHTGSPAPRGVLRSPDSVRYFDKHGVHPQDYPHPQSQVDRSGAARPVERVISVRDLRATIKPRIDACKRNAGDILVEMGNTFRERNKVYGSNYKMVAPLVRVLFPDGVPPELVASHRWHLFELKLVKLSRFAISGLTHVDSVHDDAVYSAMIEAILTNGEDQ